MPRFVSRTFHVEAHQFSGSTAELPMSFAEAMVPQRVGFCLVRCGNAMLSCSPGDWLVRGADGRIEVLPNGVFEQRFEPRQPEPGAGGYMSGITATFWGVPGGRDEDQPAAVPWLGHVFPRGKAVPVNDPHHIEKLKNNSHFMVSDPNEPPDLASAIEVVEAIREALIEPEPAVASGQTSTLTLNRKGRQS